jgi:endogenous inhibitor of DNA gyrase (YacG/DUF329 family)
MTSRQLQPKPNERIHRIECPVCKKKGDWFDGAYGPFCSHCCQLIDLGKWLGGGHVISETLRPEHFEKYAGLPPGEHLDLPEKE